MVVVEPKGSYGRCGRLEDWGGSWSVVVCSEGGWGVGRLMVASGARSGGLGRMDSEGGKWLDLRRGRITG